MGDFTTQDEVKAAYYPVVEQSLKEPTGAEKVVVFDPESSDKSRESSRAFRIGTVCATNFPVDPAFRPAARRRNNRFLLDSSR